jgi:hypothetical protein
MDIQAHQKNFVGMLVDHNLMPAFTLRLAKNHSAANPRPSKWIPWDEWDWHNRADFYTVLPNEVVFDIDAKIFFVCDSCHLLVPAGRYLLTLPCYLRCPHCDNYTHGSRESLTYSSDIAIAQQLEQRLEAKGTPYYRYPSGGKDIHYEIYLDCTDALEKNIDWMTMRSNFAEELTKGINYCMDASHDNWFIDKRKWNWNERTTLGSMLRIVGGKKIGYKTIWDHCPDKPIFATEPTFPDKLKSFKVDPIFMGPERINLNKRHLNSSNILRVRDLDICVLNMIDQIKSGNHLSHLQNLAVGARCLLAGMSDSEIHQIYANDPKYSQMRTDEQLFSIRKMLLSTPERVVSCPTIQEHGWCPSKSVCKDISAIGKG